MVRGNGFRRSRTIAYDSVSDRVILVYSRNMDDAAGHFVDRDGSTTTKLQGAYFNE
jgi:hypothetical protein